MMETQGMDMNNDESPLREEPPRPKSDATLEEGEAIQLGARLHLNEGLRPESLGTREEHLELSALKKLAEEHRRNPGEKDIPEHVATCAICLDLFQCLLDDPPVVSRHAMKRFENVPGSPRRFTDLSWFQSRPALPRAAVLFLVLLGAGVLCKSLIFSDSLVALRGVFKLANGNAILTGGGIPSHQPFTMNAGAELALHDDGTAVRAEAASEMSFSRVARGNPRFVVNTGDVWVTAAKQKPGSSILIQTPLGDIRVIGTAFRVTVESEPVVVYEHGPKKLKIEKYDSVVSAVRVVVSEGTVALGNRYEQVFVSAGQTAVMRKGQPRIEMR